MSTVFSGSLARRWWLMLLIGIITGLAVGLAMGRLLPQDLFGIVVFS